MKTTLTSSLRSSKFPIKVSDHRFDIVPHGPVTLAVSKSLGYLLMGHRLDLDTTHEIFVSNPILVGPTPTYAVNIHLGYEDSPASMWWFMSTPMGPDEPATYEWRYNHDEAFAKAQGYYGAELPILEQVIHDIAVVMLVDAFKVRPEIIQGPTGHQLETKILPAKLPIH